MSETSQQEVEVQTEAKTHNEDERSRSEDVTDQNKSRGAPTTADVEPLVLEVLKKMVRTAIAEECAAKSPAGSTLGTSSDQTPQAPGKAQPEDLAKDTSSTPSPPHSSSPVELVQQIITILKQSTIVRPDQDIRSRFWKLYKTEAEEFHVDFIKKYGDELDISLIFAGLFSAVSATFVTALQSNLAADPNATTQVLLMMIVRSLNSTAFPGQDLILPQFTGPDRTTIWVQSLLYASLGASLFAALAAMLGKEWVGHYARVGDSGSIEDRCIDRQSKLIAMRAWRFDMVLACIPLLLQGSLLLFGVALSVYMWSQQHVIAGVIVAVNVVGVLLYGVLLMCSLVFPDCPYHIPLTDLTMAARDRLLPHLLQVTSSITQMVSYLFLKRELESPPTLPITAPAITNITAAVVKPNARLQLDAPCVEWLLMTSTDPEALIAAARMALEVDLAQVKFDPTAVQQLDKMFRSCFVSPESSSSGAHELLPSNYERAAVYGQALLGIYLDRHLMHSTIKSTLDPPDFGWLHRTAKLIQDHPDSRFICEVLSVLFPPKDMDDDDRCDLVPGPSDAPTPPHSSVIDWFSHHMLYCIYSINPEDASQSWIRHYFVTFMLQWVRSGQLTARARANCSVACSMLVGCRVSFGSLAVNNKSDVASFHAVVSFQRLDIPSSLREWNEWCGDYPRRLLLVLSTYLQSEYLPEYDLGHSMIGMRKILDFYSAVLRGYFAEEPSDAVKDYTRIFKGAGDVSPPLSSLICFVTSDIMSRGFKFEGQIAQHSQEWCSHLLRQERRIWSARYVFDTKLVQDNGDVAPSTVRDLNMDDVSGLLQAIELVRDILKAVPDKDDVERLEDQLISFSFLLSEVRDIHTGTPHLDSSFYDSLSFLASHTIPIVRYAALKIIRNLCGDTEGEVDQGSLEGLVENMGDIDKFCAVLSSCAPEMRRPEDENDYIIRSTRVYLELVGGLCGSWMEHFRRQYAPQLMAIADNLATNSDGDVDWGLVWNTHWNAWKPLVKILFQCEEHEPGFIQHLPSTSSAHEAELKLDIARTPWWSGFSDSDAHPHSCIPVMVKYTVDTWARQKLLEGHVLRGLRWLRYDLKDRIDEGVLGNQSKAMLDAACGVWDKLQPLFVQAGLEEGSENKEEGEMIIEEGEGEEVDDTDMVQKEGQADKDQSKETKAEHENESEHEEAAAIESIPPTTGVVYDLEAGGDA